MKWKLRCTNCGFKGELNVKEIGEDRSDSASLYCPSCGEDENHGLNMKAIK